MQKQVNILRMSDTELTINTFIGNEVFYTTMKVFYTYIWLSIAEKNEINYSCIFSFSCQLFFN